MTNIKGAVMSRQQNNFQIKASTRSQYFLLVALAAMTAISGCSSLQNNLQSPDVMLITIQPQSLRDGRTLIAVARLRVSNPNSIALPISGGRVNMTLAGKTLAVGVLIDGFKIPANSSQEVDIRVNLDLASSITLGMRLLDDDTELQYTLSGHIDVGIAYLGRVNFAKQSIMSLNQFRTPESGEH